MTNRSSAVYLKVLNSESHRIRCQDLVRTTIARSFQDPLLSHISTAKLHVSAAFILKDQHIR